MMKLFLAAGVAALAVTAPAAAGPGNGGGKGGKGQSAQVQKGGGKAQAQAQARRGNGGGKAQAQARRGNGGGKAQAQRFERAKKAQEQRFEGRKRMAEQREKAREKAFERASKRDEKRFEAQKRFAEDRAKAREKGRERGEKALKERNKMAEKAFERRNKAVEKVAERRREMLERNRDSLGFRDWDDRVMPGRALGFVDGCPPGLAAKPIPCMPPGQAKQLLGKRITDVDEAIAFREIPDRLRTIYRETDDYYYRYGNGYAYRIDRETQLINALLPLFGIGATVGQPFPSAYSNHYMPSPLQAFYPDTQYNSYRYANGYVYEVDPYTGMIEDVDPMLGYGYGYGQMMPASYSAYNVPYQYRSYYSDTPDHYYRYAPGAIYRVDSGSGLIDAVSALLTGGMAVGQPLPMGYDAYNVPLAYRDQYYDTPDNWYRYANGNIYQVDPTTRLVTAIIQALI